MANASNKVKYGLKNVYYAPATVAADGTATYGTPVHIPGAVNLALDPQGSTSTFRADNIDYWTGTTNNGYSGDLEMALIPDDFRTAILGEFVDSNSVQVEEVVNTTRYFALLFEFDGDAHAVRHVMYKCTATRPAVSSATTPADEIEPQTETMTITCGAIHIEALNKDVVKAKVNPAQTTQYNAWFENVYLPTGAAA